MNCPTFAVSNRVHSPSVALNGSYIVERGTYYCLPLAILLVRNWNRSHNPIH